MIDSKQAIEALSEIDDIAHRVRQSFIYDVSSQMMIMWGALVFAGNLVTYFTPRYADAAWMAVYVLGIPGWFALGVMGYARIRVHTFDARMLAAVLMFFAFGFFVTGVLGQFTPRQLGTFWPLYFMLVYALAGLWIGMAFVAIGAVITALTLVGYFFIGHEFPLWMAFVNGLGLILSDLWMRWS
jgi:hypothetical protein